MIGLFKCVSKDATGAVNFIARSAALPNSLMRQGQQGWAMDSTGAGYTEDAGSAVPSTAIRSQGVAFTPDGAMYTTNTAPAVGASRICGFAVRSDGALHIGGSDLTIGARIQGVAISTDGRVISGSPANLSFVDRYWDARYLVTAAATRVSNWLDMKQGTDLAQASGGAQPILLPYGGVNYLWLPGVNGNQASFDELTPPGAGAFSYTAKIRVTSLSNNSYFFGTPANGCMFYVTAFGTGTIRVGKNGVILLTASTGTIAAGVDVTIGYTRSGTTGTYYIDGVAAGTITDSQDYTAGATLNGNDGTTGAADGRCYSSRVYNVALTAPQMVADAAGVVQSGCIFNANYSSAPEGATSFTESSANAATVTINSTGAKPAQIVGSQQILGDGSAMFLRAAFTLAAPYFVVGLFRANTWVSGRMLFDGATADTFSAQQVTGSPQIRMFDGVSGTTTVSPTLKTYSILVATQTAAGATTLQVNLGTAATGTLNADAMGGLTLFGRGDGAALGAGQCKALCQGSTEISAYQLTQLIRAMAAQCGVSL